MLGFSLLFYTLFRVLVPDGELLSYIDGFEWQPLSLASWILIALFSGSAVSNWIVSAWPGIDLDTGPEHERSAKRRRGRIGVFYGSIVVPIVWLLIARLVG